MMNFSLVAAVILLVFYLYLLVRPAHIRNSSIFLIGAGGFALCILGSFFTFISLSRWAYVLSGIFTVIGVLAAFGGAFIGCYGGKLPMDIPGHQAKPSAEGQTPPPPETGV